MLGPAFGTACWFTQLSDFVVMRKDAQLAISSPRVTEIATEVDRHPHAAYFRQAHYGVAVRKALIALLLGKAEKVLEFWGEER